MENHFSHASADSKRLFYIAAGIAILVVATAIRIYGAMNDLWLDEIWSLGIAERVTSPMDVFTKLHHEINHYLYTLYFWCLGNHGNWLGYRIPSLVAGSGTVVLAGLIGRRRNITSAFFAMLLVGFSYVMVLYSSEARGYALAVFFSFLSYYALDCYLAKPHWPFAVVFSVSAILGLASQPISAGVLFAALIWSAYRLVKSRLRWKRVVVDLLSCHAVPVIFLAVLYCVDIHKIAAGQGTASPSLIHSYGTALAWALGTPSADVFKFLACIAAVAIFVAGIRLLWREQSDAPIFFIGVILVFPVLLIVMRESNVVYTRHFIIGMAFLLILFSFILASLYDRCREGRVACAFLLAIYFLINGQHVMQLFQFGRGHFGAALRFISDNTETSLVTIGGNHDSRISLMLRFYSGEVMTNKTVEYYKINSWPPAGPEWVICQKESFEEPISPYPQFTERAGKKYELEKTYPTAPLSGLHWFIYHNVTH